MCAAGCAVGCLLQGLDDCLMSIVSITTGNSNKLRGPLEPAPLSCCSRGHAYMLGKRTVCGK